MEPSAKPPVILLADDDADDREMTRKAIMRSMPGCDLRSVTDGEELLDYLHHRGAYVRPEIAPTPGLILLDLNMPKMDGREALAQIKEDQRLRRIPVVVMTTSKAEQDICRTYDLGSNSYITKPLTFLELVETMRVLGQYWFQIVKLPEPLNA